MQGQSSTFGSVTQIGSYSEPQTLSLRDAQNLSLLELTHDNNQRRGSIKRLSSPKGQAIAEVQSVTTGPKMQDGKGGEGPYKRKRLTELRYEGRTYR